MNPELKDITTDAIKYWEKYRIVYNLILLFPTYLGYQIASGFPNPDPVATTSSPNLIVDLVILCIGANFCYTFAYVPDFFIQLSDFKESWRKKRIILFVFGTIFASYLALNCATMLPAGIQWN